MVTRSRFFIIKYDEQFEIVFGNGQVTDKIYRNGLKTSFKVLKEIIFTIKSVLWRFRKVYYTSEFRFRGAFLVCELWYYYSIIKNLFDWSDLNERLCGSN